MPIQIHPTAIIDPKAQFGTDVQVGPYAIIEGDVIIGDRTQVHHHAFIADGARIGADCIVHHSAVVANTPQDLKFKGEEKTFAEIGDGSTIREFATIHRATIHSGKYAAGTHDSVTRIGKNCLIMAYAHVAHDCLVGDNVILSNSAQLGGHVSVESFAIIGGLTGLHQFSQIGGYSMVGGGLMITKDIPPYSLIGDQPARFGGINRIGLERKGFTPEKIEAIRKAYKCIYYSGMNVADGLSAIENDPDLQIAEVTRIVEFIRGSDRGIISH
ncbi:MAG: acyl-ACP--UDP-N-acetylglucosamine O-acyltransferase [Ignavibacteriota bacterium]